MICDYTLKQIISTSLRGFHVDHINAITYFTNYKYAYEH